jgi:hypothetical protein
MSGHIERPKSAAARLGVGNTKFDEAYVDKGGDPFVPGTDGQVMRVRPFPLGKRAVGFFSDEIDELIEQLRAWRDKQPRTPPKRAVSAEFHPSQHRKNIRKEARDSDR